MNYIFRITLKGFFIYLVAWIIALFYSYNTVDINANNKDCIIVSKEITVRDRIEYSFKNLQIADSIYDDAINEKNVKRKKMLLKKAERFSKMSLNFYPHEHYNYILLMRIYTELENEKQCGIMEKKLREIEDQYYTRR